MNVLSSVFSTRFWVPGSASRRYSVGTAGLFLALTLCLLLLSACNGTDQKSNTNGGTPAVALKQLQWCDKPFIVFSDLKNSSANATATGTPNILPTLDTSNGTATTNTPTITDWQKVKPQLDFTTYLPETLPQGSCLVSVTGTVHDPIFGSSFTVSYLMPDHSSVNLAEAPLRAQNPEFQCSLSSTPDSTGKGTPKAQSSSGQQIQLCSGARDKTSITFSAVGSNDFVKQFYNGLAANVNWVPASTK